MKLLYLLILLPKMCSILRNWLRIVLISWCFWWHSWRLDSSVIWWCSFCTCTCCLFWCIVLQTYTSVACAEVSTIYLTILFYSFFLIFSLLFKFTFNFLADEIICCNSSFLAVWSLASSFLIFTCFPFYCSSSIWFIWETVELLLCCWTLCKLINEIIHFVYETLILSWLCLLQNLGFIWKELIWWKDLVHNHIWFFGINMLWKELSHRLFYTFQTLQKMLIKNLFGIFIKFFILL